MAQYNTGSKFSLKGWLRRAWNRASTATYLTNSSGSSDLSKRDADALIEAVEEKRQSVRKSLPPSLTAQGKDCIAPFRREEIIIGPLLGSGEFSNVYEIKSFRIKEKPGAGEETAALSTDEVQTRLSMKERQKYHQTCNARYALKRLKGEYLEDCCVKDLNTCVQAVW